MSKGKNRSLYYQVVLFFCFGILATLSIETIRYTKFVEPSTVEMGPREVYQTIVDNPDEALFFDVRTIGEYTNLHASSSVSVPIQQLYDKWKTLPRSGKKIYLICSSGRLAAIAYGYLQLHGFTNLVHVTGGMQNWVDLGVPVVAKQIFVDPNFSLDKPVIMPSGTKK
jgi:rhodanese-related sulfurtransferase